MVIIKNAYLWVMLGLLTIVVACNPNKADLPTAVGPIAKVQFLNLIATPTTPNNAINLYINGTRQNSNPISFGLNSSYLNIASGAQTVAFKDSLLNYVFAPAAITIPTDSSTFYLTANSLNGLITSRDTAKVDTIGYKPKVRFIHASPDGPAYDLVLSKVNSKNVVQNTITISNKAYKAISASARPDTGKVIVNLNAAGTSTVILTRTYTLVNNKVYTMYVYGSVKGTNGAGLNFGVITNH